MPLSNLTKQIYSCIKELFSQDKIGNKVCEQLFNFI